jgi:hypothetical protein
MQANFLVLPVIVASVACVARGVLAGSTLGLVALMTLARPTGSRALSAYDREWRSTNREAQHFAVSPPIQTEAMT